MRSLPGKMYTCRFGIGLCMHALLRHVILDAFRDGAFIQLSDVSFAASASVECRISC